MLPMAGELVRHLVVELIPAEDLAPVLAGEGSRSFPLEGQLEEYAAPISAWAPRLATPYGHALT
jgi:hypothetical protein